MVRFVRLAPVVLVPALVLAACGGGSGSSAGPATAVPSGVVAVQAEDYKFTPSTISVPAGEVTFSVKNVAGQEHEFEIFRPDGTVLDEVEGLVPGLTKDLKVTLAAGTYEFMCKLNGHDQLGMKGTLTVQ
jgi:iron uptake system component EfeO